MTSERWHHYFIFTPRL